MIRLETLVNISGNNDRSKMESGLSMCTYYTPLGSGDSLSGSMGEPSRLLDNLMDWLCLHVNYELRSLASPVVQLLLHKLLNIFVACLTWK